MQPLIYKQVLDHENNLMGLELWQGSQYITVSLRGSTSNKAGYKWDEVRDFVDNLAEKSRKQIESSMNDDLFSKRFLGAVVENATKTI